MKEYSIGLDVHKDSVFMAVSDDRRIRSDSTVDSNLVDGTEVPTNSPGLINALRVFQEKGKIFVVYEAGCLGFDVCHFLDRHGIAFQIMAANRVFRPGDEKKIKTDRRDAVLIARIVKRGKRRASTYPAGRRRW
jgi:transposase